jgi:hypothetical protein
MASVTGAVSPVVTVSLYSAFDPHAQRNVFYRRDAHQQSRWFANWNQLLRRSPGDGRHGAKEGGGKNVFVL